MKKEKRIKKRGCSCGGRNEKQIDSRKQKWLFFFLVSERRPREHALRLGERAKKQTTGQKIGHRKFGTEKMHVREDRGKTWGKWGSCLFFRGERNKGAKKGGFVIFFVSFF